MSTIDTPRPPPLPGPPPLPSAVPRIRLPRPGALAQFLGRENAFFGLLVRGSILMLLTLGIYRFWLATDVRRFLWGNTELAGDGLEYTGTAKELLVGFLMAIALLAPINALIVLSGILDKRLLGISGPLGFALLTVLGQFAIFRARRYRLSRTVFRGIRLYQTGSAWRYAFMSIGWWIVVGVTLGLAYPWMVASLERYKLRHTHYGTLDGHFAGTGTALFLRGIVLWLVVVGPLCLGIVGAVVALSDNWAALDLLLSARSGTLQQRLNDVGPMVAGALVLAGAGVMWGGLAAALLYPLFRAIVLRWWVSGLRLGAIAATSRLRVGQIYGVYLRMIGFAFLFALGTGVVGGILAGVFGALAKTIGRTDGFQIIAAITAVASYTAVMLGYSAIYQATVLIRFWRLSFEMTEFSGVEALNHVEARGVPASPFGEGLAGVLDVGGL
jgi:uncharacterized membrane protein YjgN (DUF898 family)